MPVSLSLLDDIHLVSVLQHMSFVLNLNSFLLVSVSKFYKNFIRIKKIL